MSGEYPFIFTKTTGKVNGFVGIPGAKSLVGVRTTKGYREGAVSFRALRERFQRRQFRFGAMAILSGSVQNLTSGW